MLASSGGRAAFLERPEVERPQMVRCDDWSRPSTGRSVWYFPVFSFFANGGLASDSRVPMRLEAEAVDSANSSLVALSYANMVVSAVAESRSIRKGCIMCRATVASSAVSPKA